jgi:lysophospholipase L1-like esterase
VALALVGLELGARAFYPDRQPRLAGSGLRIDERYGLSFRPGARGWFTSLRGEYATYVVVNDQGLRDVPHTYAKPDGVTRVAVLGDSLTAGLQVPLQQTFAGVLQSGLAGLGGAGSYEVINAGVVGYGTANELLFYEGEVRKYDPDIVLAVFFTGNDVTDNVNAPLFDLRDGSLVRMPSALGSDHLLAPWERPARGLRALRNFLYTHSRLYSVAVEAVAVQVARRLPPVGRFLSAMGFVELARPVPNWGNLYLQNSPPAQAWPMTEALLGELARQVEADGAQLVVAILPDEAEVDRRLWQEITSRNGPTSADGAASAAPTEPVGQMPSARLEALLTRLGIEHISLVTAMRRAIESGRVLFYPYDGHLTPTGHRVVGEELVAWLSRRPTAAR